MVGLICYKLLPVLYIRGFGLKWLHIHVACIRSNGQPSHLYFSSNVHWYLYCENNGISNSSDCYSLYL
jgi:hypothetical protein